MDWVKCVGLRLRVSEGDALAVGVLDAEVERQWLLDAVPLKDRLELPDMLTLQLGDGL